VSEMHGFSYEGGMTCARCAYNCALSPEDFRVFSAFSESEDSCPEAEAGPELFRALVRYASYQLDHDLRSVRVLEQMFGRAGTARHGGQR